MNIRLHCLPGALLAGFLAAASMSTSLVGDFETPADLEGGARVWAEPALQPYAVFTGDFFTNVHGGNNTGGVWTGLLDIATSEYLIVNKCPGNLQLRLYLTRTYDAGV